MKFTSLSPVLAAVLASVATAGCSTTDDSDGSAGVSVNGSVGSLTLTAQAAIAGSGTLATSTVTDDDGGTTTTNITGLTIEIADKKDTCTEFHLASTTILSLALVGTPTAGSTFTVIDADVASPTDGQAEADISASTATCADNGESATATNGTVAITAISSSEVSGTFDVTFSAGHLTGNFTAPICAAPTATDDAGALACDP
jgi:hypothetical protein